MFTSWTTENNDLPSVKRFTFEVKLSDKSYKSFMKIKTNNGPRRNTCETPARTLVNWTLTCLIKNIH